MINIVGYFSGQFGIGIAARNIARAVASATGQEPCCSLLPSGGGRDVVQPPFATPPMGQIALRYPATLLVCAAIPSEADVQVARLVKQRGGLLAVLAYWEMTEVPQSSLPFLQMADVLYAGSPFTLDVFRRTFPRKPCHELPCPAWLRPSDHPSDRAGFGLPDAAPIALTTFEPMSDHMRKNSAAAVRAFLDSSSEHEGRLVLKINWPSAVPRNDASPLFAAARRLIDEARASSRIHVIDETLPYDRLLRLYASVDVLISLHRAEGLGLVMLEGMTLGKGVIATAYSGNLAFMRPDHPGLVPYSPVAANGTYGFYNAGSGAFGPQAPTWAEPDVAAASRLLARAFNDAAFAAELRSAGLEMAGAYERRALGAEWLQHLRPRFQNPYSNVSYSFG